jgi:hypothetical protein
MRLSARATTSDRQRKMNANCAGCSKSSACTADHSNLGFIRRLKGAKTCGTSSSRCSISVRINRFTERPQLQKFLSHIAGGCSVRKCHDQTILSFEFHGQHSYRFDHREDLYQSGISGLYRFARFPEIAPGMPTCRASVPS